MDLYTATITIGGEPVIDLSMASRILGTHREIHPEAPEHGVYLVELEEGHSKTFRKRGFVEIEDDLDGDSTLITVEGS